MTMRDRKWAKLIPSVYLIIKLNESNDELRTEKFTICVHHQWSFVVGGPDENPRNLIFGKSVDVRYVEELVNPFEDLHFEGTDKENAEQQKKKN
ncbi:unnamed protein product [Rhizophagus irregularis]|nr:unnamed protein product [Rhizophagus irregularis]